MFSTFARAAALVCALLSFLNAVRANADPVDKGSVTDPGVRLLFVVAGSPDEGSPDLGYGARVAILPRPDASFALGLEAGWIWPGAREWVFGAGPFVKWSPRRDARFPPHLHLGLGYAGWKHRISRPEPDEFRDYRLLSGGFGVEWR